MQEIKSKDMEIIKNQVTEVVSGEIQKIDKLIIENLFAGLVNMLVEKELLKDFIEPSKKETLSKLYESSQKRVIELLELADKINIKDYIKDLELNSVIGNINLN